MAIMIIKFIDNSDKSDGEYVLMLLHQIIKVIIICYHDSYYDHQRCNIIINHNYDDSGGEYAIMIMNLSLYHNHQNHDRPHHNVIHKAIILIDHTDQSDSKGL